MSSKLKIVVSTAIILVSVAVGRFTAPEKVRIETKTVEVEKKTDDKTLNKHEHKVTETVTKPDGTSVTTVTDDTVTGVTDNKTDNIATTTDSVKEVTRSSGGITLSALGGFNIHDPGVPVYGGMISKPLLGPIGVGAFGLTNGTFGAALSLTL